MTDVLGWVSGLLLFFAVYAQLQTRRTVGMWGGRVLLACQVTGSTGFVAAAMTQGTSVALGGALVMVTALLGLVLLASATGERVTE